MKFPQFVWYKKLECKVEVIKTGHFPTSLIVKLPDGKMIETDSENLTRIDNDTIEN